MIKAGPYRRLANRKLLVIKNTDNIGCQLGFELLNISILITEIPKNVTAAFYGFQFFSHRIARISGWPKTGPAQLAARSACAGYEGAGSGDR